MPTLHHLDNPHLFFIILSIPVNFLKWPLLGCVSMKCIILTLLMVTVTRFMINIKLSLEMLTKTEAQDSWKGKVTASRRTSNKISSLYAAAFPVYNFIWTPLLSVILAFLHLRQANLKLDFYKNHSALIKIATASTQDEFSLILQPLTYCYVVPIFHWAL